MAIYDKPIQEISREDLDDLRQVQEGWFIEFKSACPESSKVAKSISSFANAHGGLLVIGVKENAKTRRLDSFSLLTKQGADEICVKIRQAVESHLRPCPLFFCRVIEATEDGREGWLVLVKIPKGDLAPYLHSNGCIYSRKGDSSSPEPLNDLGLIDKLWSARHQRRLALKERILFLREQSRSGIPRLEIFVALGESAGEDDPIFGEIAFSKFEELAKAPILPNNPPLFDSVYTLDTSFVARRTEGHSESITLLWDYDHQRRLHFLSVPLATYQWDSENFVHEDGGMFSRIRPHLIRHNIQSGFIIDITYAVFFISACLYKIAALHRSLNRPQQLRLNVVASDVRRAFVVVDLPRFFSHLEESPPPYIYREVGFVQPLEDVERWFEMQVEDTALEEKLGSKLDIVNALAFFARAAWSLGIPENTSLAMTSAGATPDFNEIVALFSRLASASFSFSSGANPRP